LAVDKHASLKGIGLSLKSSNMSMDVMVFGYLLVAYFLNCYTYYSCKGTFPNNSRIRHILQQTMGS
ncbi:MAG TPA: hypothetical protein VE378_00915, partial [Nitrososphaeraceae archaeon]|nr:hypothetical protein [Nitrososphaeraceae archaeon]